MRNAKLQWSGEAAAGCHPQPDLPRMGQPRTRSTCWPPRSRSRASQRDGTPPLPDPSPSQHLPKLPGPPPPPKHYLLVCSSKSSVVLCFFINVIYKDGSSKKAEMRSLGVGDGFVPAPLGRGRILRASRSRTPQTPVLLAPRRTSPGGKDHINRRVPWEAATLSAAL